MQIVCKICNTTVVFDTGAAPKFCSECGASLAGLTPTGSTQDDNASNELLDTTALQRPTSTEQNTRTQQPTPSPNRSTLDKDKGLSVESVGPYQLVRQLGQGGMGSVYEAIHQETGQAVALKLLLPTLRGTDESVQRFRRESQIAASINHPRSTFVYEASQHQEQFYITMELMKGGTLKDLVTQHGPLEVGQAVDYILDIIEGLMVAHTAGIVHRDIKPSNCFLDLQGRAKIGDFGLAKSFLGDAQLTQTGAFMGTPQYAAPEQLRSSDIDERTDIYAIGATLFYLLAGRPSFVGNPAQVIASIASETPPNISEFAPHIPRPLERLIAQTMEKDATKRPQNLELLRKALLPYASRGASLADIGRRVAAFFIDLTLAGIIAATAGLIGTILSTILIQNQDSLFANIQTANTLFQITSLVGYFAICEHLWGRGVGKWLLGMRVIAKNMESPSYPAAITRALIVPGLTWLISSISAVIITANSPTDVPQSLNNLGMLQVVSLLSWAPVLICMMTARRNNGYQGIHGLISGTRVVRLSGELEFRRVNSIPTTVPSQLANQQNRSFGAYETVGCFDDQLTPTTYLGTDSALDRDVWIFNDVPPDSLTNARRSCTRASRLRVLQVGSQNGQHWYVTEAVKGMPLVEALHHSEFIWTTVRPLLLELAIELKTASASGTLPDHLSIDHVWIDDTGRIKLLDFPVVQSHSPVDASFSATTQAADSKPQNHLVLTLINQFLAHHDAPAHVREMQAELATMASEEGMLSTAITRLNQSAERASTWNWDDRLGVLAITAGFELTLMSTLICLSGLACVTLKLPMTATFITITVVGSLAAWLSGYGLDGGLAFRMADVAILRSKTSEPTSKIRSAIRNWLSWVPVILLWSIFFLLLHYSVSRSFANTQGAGPETTTVLPIIYLFLASVPVFGFMIAMNLLVSLLSPSRGLADFLTGTQLARK